MRVRNVIVLSHRAKQMKIEGVLHVRQLNNAMDIFRILKQTNCGACSVPTCLAFAAAVFRGEKRLEDCPHMEPGEISRWEVNNDDSRTLDRELEKYLEELQRTVATIDLAASAERLGASFADDALTIKCLGKDFAVDSHGNVVSDCHVHGWVTVRCSTMSFPARARLPRETGSPCANCRTEPHGVGYSSSDVKGLSNVWPTPTPICSKS